MKHNKTKNNKILISEYNNLQKHTVRGVSRTLPLLNSSGIATYVRYAYRQLFMSDI